MRIAIFLSFKGLIPFAIENNVVKCVFTAVGIILIIEGLVCFFGADFVLAGDDNRFEEYGRKMAL